MAKESVPTAFELLFQKLFEIAEIMQKNDKKTAVSVIKTQFPEFADMLDNTVKTNITSFPFLVSEFGSLKSELDTVKKENTVLHNELDNIRQELSKEKDISQNIENLETENESLKTELDNLRQNSDKGSNDMDVIRELQGLKKRVVAIETVIQGNVSQKLDSVLDKNISKLDMPEFIDGWKVVFKKPYWKMYKTINGKLHWIHIGKEFSEDIAKEKIRQKLSKLDEI